LFKTSRTRIKQLQHTKSTKAKPQDYRTSSVSSIGWQQTKPRKGKKKAKLGLHSFKTILLCKHLSSQNKLIQVSFKTICHSKTHIMLEKKATAYSTHCHRNINRIKFQGLLDKCLTLIKLPCSPKCILTLGQLMIFTTKKTRKSLKDLSRLTKCKSYFTKPKKCYLLKSFGVLRAITSSKYSWPQFTIYLTVLSSKLSLPYTSTLETDTQLISLEQSFKSRLGTILKTK